MGINTNDEIEAVEIGEHSETPGLGAKVKDKAFLEQFHGKGTGAQLAAVKSLSEDGSVDASSSSTVDAESSATTETESSATVDAEGSATTESDDSAITDTEGSATTDTEGSATPDASGSATVDGSSSATGELQEAYRRQAISGATVTSGAVTRAINLAIQYYNQIILSGWVLMKASKAIINGIITENPTFRLVLGMCPTLAVTTAAINGIGMGLAPPLSQ